VRILVIEDERRILSFLERGLAAAGHHVITAESGEDGVELAQDDAVDLVLLDIRLPGMDGHDVLARIRRRRADVPVLMLTARDDVDHKVRALDAGADDYLTKPFAFEELLARIRALTRRSDQPQASRLEIGSLRLDLLSRRAWRGDRAIELSNREFALLEYFMRHPDQVLSRSQILFAVWDYEFAPGSNVVDVYVRYVRRKLAVDRQPSPIVTVHGTGYRLDPSRA